MTKPKNKTKKTSKPKAAPAPAASSVTGKLVPTDKLEFTKTGRDSKYETLLDEVKKLKVDGPSYVLPSNGVAPLVARNRVSVFLRKRKAEPEGIRWKLRTTTKGEVAISAVARKK